MMNIFINLLPVWNKATVESTKYFIQYTNIEQCRTEIKRIYLLLLEVFTVQQAE